MTVLADTPEHLVEFEGGLLWIVRRSDGRFLTLAGKGIAGHFRDCLRTHAPARVVQTWLRIAGRRQDWKGPLYKDGFIPAYEGRLPDASLSERLDAALRLDGEATPAPVQLSLLEGI